MNKDAFFSEHYKDFCFWIERRRPKWRAISVLEFDDVKSILLSRIYQQLDLYDEKRPLDRWTNTLISNGIRNLLRDNVYRDARPCVSGKAPGCGGGSSYGSGCAYNQGENKCGWTKSGVQDSTCPFYAKWVKKKQTKFAISTPLSIENHTDEYNTKPGDIVDEEWIEDKKKLMDVRILARLNREEARIYRLLFIKHLEEEEVGKKMGYKKQANSNVCGYSQIRAIKIRIREVAEQIISEEGII